MDKWSETISDLLDLAIMANKNFDFERSLRYLASMEELWQSKGLPAFSKRLRIGLHDEKGKALSRLGRYTEAVEEYKCLLDFFQGNGMLERRLEVFLSIGQLLAKTGDYDRALGYVHRALSGSRRQSNPEGVCKSLRNLGVIYFELGEFEDAQNAYEEAIEISKQNDLSLLYADLYNNLGTIKNVQGNWEEALDCYSISTEVFEREGEVRKSAYTFNNIGITYLEQERPDDAERFFVRALEIANTIKDESLVLILNINMADLCLKKQRVADARKYCLYAEKYLTSNRLRNTQLAETEKLAGKIAMAENDYERALEFFEQSLNLCKELRLQFMEAEVLLEMGNLFFSSGSHMEALQVLEKAIHLFGHLDASQKMEKAEELTISIEELYLKVFEAMGSKVDRKDHYTKGHSDRVARISLYMAEKLSLSLNDRKAIVAGALLHDIGKIEIPDQILKKPGRLTPEEFDEIKKHPDAGVRLLSGIRLPWDVIPIIRHHHEKFDGGGYPAGLSGDLIPIGARIIGVADVFDALTSARPYRNAHSQDEAMIIMKREMSSSFDPVVLGTLIDLINTGSIDNILNRQTEADELHKIWALCSFSHTGDVARCESVISTAL